MPLTPGARLGPYEIVGPLGSGGMGEVYRARDTRLERTVAIKVMPPHVAADPGARDRFEREARIISSLDHPHICALYDVGDDYLVMQYLEGETLADRIARGPMPLEELLRYAIEIASALDAAHRAGVVHRDLKPGNVMLTTTGARLLDFGLAKPGTAAVSGSVSVMPTMEQALTAQGTILGTFQYMAPEQVEGKDADHRTDIFAFGCVLYEMATGRRAFTGSTPASLIGAILHVDPPSISSVRAQIAGDAAARPDVSALSMLVSRPVPAAFERLVRKCLAKDAARRWQCGADLADELRWIAESQSAADAAVSVSRTDAAALGARPSSRRERIAWAAAAVFALAAVAVPIWLLTRTSPAPLVTRSAIPVDGQLASGIHTIAISPQGTHIAYVTTEGGTNQLNVRALNQSAGVTLKGTNDAAQPFFSPDGQSIAFFSAGKLKRIAVSGGAPLTLCELPSQARGGAWGPDDTIIFAAGPTTGLYRVNANGGATETLTTPDPKVERGHRWPTFLPGGQVMFSILTVGPIDESKVAVLSLQTREFKVVFQGGNYPRYAPTGHLLVTRAGTLLAVPFDLSALAVRGGPVPVIEGIAMSPSNGSSQYAIAETGTLVYTFGDSTRVRRPLVLTDRAGVATPLLAPRAFSQVRFSPDGRKLALTIAEPSQEVWTYDFQTKATTRLTFTTTGLATAPVWTPKAERIVYASAGRTATPNLYWKPADGSGAEEHLLASNLPHLPASVSPDGNYVAYVETGGAGGPDIWVLPLTEARKPRPLITTPFAELAPRFSPDGRWIAYHSNESGRPEVYVQPFPGPGAKFQVSTDGGMAPVWTSHGGGELVFRNGQAVMAASVTLSPSFSHRLPVKLFEMPFVSADVTRDGRQFAVIQEPADADRRAQLELVANWLEELKQKVPSRSR